MEIDTQMNRGNGSIVKIYDQNESTPQYLQRKRDTSHWFKPRKV